MTHRVSIVIPTRNEAADIAGTLDALDAIEAPDASVEALVVDASTDGTADIVRARKSSRTRLLVQSSGGGRAAARTQGILEATGDVLVILNADVRLPPDFVTRILRHYDAGADYVLVESRVCNLEHASARYVQALHELQYPDRPDIAAAMNWTEGFSCRRAAALAVGAFPQGTPVPLVAGEDGWFGDKLAAAHYKKTFDRSIVVRHVAPSSLPDFWRQRVGRGRGWPQVLHARHRWTAGRLTVLAAKIVGRRALRLLVPLPSVWRGWKLSAHSPRGRRDWPRMSALEWIDSLATAVGVVAGVAELRKASRS